jgi:aspartate carbamoyltransferase catalytic subunit
MHTLKAMQIDMFVIRHKQSGLPHHVAENIEGVSILNAGDGTNAHPTAYAWYLVVIHFSWWLSWLNQH